MRLTTRVAEGDATDSTQVTEGATVTPVEAEGAAAHSWRGREGDAAHSTQGGGRMWLLHARRRVMRGSVDAWRRVMWITPRKAEGSVAHSTHGGGPCTGSGPAVSQFRAMDCQCHLCVRKDLAI